MPKASKTNAVKKAFTLVLGLYLCYLAIREVLQVAGIVSDDKNS